MTFKVTTVSQAAADSVQGSQGGFCDATTSTSEEGLDLSAFAGRYVKIYCETVDHYYTFAPSGVTGVLDETAKSTYTDYVVDRLEFGARGTHEIVPREKPVLRFKAVSGTGKIRIIPK